MNWLVLIISFAIAVLIGSFLASKLERSRPDWSPRRRKWTAAAALPAFIVLATIAGIGLTMVTTPAPGEGYRGLYSGIYAMVGAVFFVITLLGGLVGAAAAVRKDGT
jgi:hypothetical protein